MQATSQITEPQAKRRKPRKGTRSCWECKRRKVRCLVVSPDDGVCIACSERGADCVGQELPDPTTPTAKSRLVGQRLVRMEAMIARLAEQASASATTTPVPLESRHQTSSGRSPTPARSGARLQTWQTSSGGIPTPAASDTPTLAGAGHEPLAPSGSSSSEGLVIPGYFAYDHDTPAVSPNHPHPSVIISSAATPSAGNDRLQDISRALLAAYPGEKYVEVLAADGVPFMNAYKTMFRSYRELEVIMDLPASERPELQLLHARHDSTAHPVVIAQQMFFLANILQHADSRTLARLGHLSDEPPRAVMARLAKAAIELVTSNDQMLGTAEGLECLALESIYQADGGNLRLSWLARRRLIGLSQAIGIHRRTYRALVIKSLQANCVLDPRIVWYRILCLDRFLSLMLGLPAASLDTSMVSEPALSQDTPMGQLERRHCVAAGRILDRNDRGPSADDFAHTQSIDTELQRAASLMPSRWWLAPDLRAVTDEKQLFWESLRLVNQIYHFYLLHQLHLPYMLLSSTSSADQRQYDYSRNTCTSASRDILNRCLLFHSHGGVPFSTCIIDFLALMASLTLLLTHLSCRRNSSTGAILAHQRLSDRALMEQALENMERVGPGNGDEPSSKGARMLRQLLAINTDPAAASTGPGDPAGDGFIESNVADPLRFFVPYFGVVSVSRDGMVTTEPNHAGQDPSPPTPNGAQRWAVAAMPAGGQGPRQHDESARQSLGIHVLGADDAVPVRPMGDPGLSEARYPLPTAGADQWALQGVDFAFFDSLMRETAPSTDGNGDGLWPWSIPPGI